jgi:prevent-host-death family protein
MKNNWQVQEAKNRLSELLDEARRHGPQVVTRRGVDTAVVLSIEDYKRLVGPQGSLVDFFRQSPLVGVELELERRPDLARDVEL